MTTETIERTATPWARFGKVRTVHDLKCNPDSYTRIANGQKRAEVRLNDRDYQAGDLLLLRELYDEDFFGADIWENNHRERIQETGFTGETMLARVTDVFPGGQYGIDPGYVLLSIERVAFLGDR